MFSAFELRGRKARRIQWEAEVLPPARLKFQLRWASTTAELKESKWVGPNGENTCYKKSGQKVRGMEPDTTNFLQYRVTFEAPYGCRSPQLREVRIDLDPGVN